MTLKTYKALCICVIVILYTFAIWHISAKYTKADWESEKTALVQKALDTQQQRQELANQIGKQLDEKLSNMQSKHSDIKERVIREIVKEPVYTNCVTTPDGVRLIQDAIHNKGLPTNQQHN